jgi:hypothetical protein
MRCLAHQLDYCSTCNEVPSPERLLATWQAWSLNGLYTRAAAKARQRGDEHAAARLDQVFTDSPPVAGLDALAANHELVRLLSGWQWHAVYASRRDGASWAEIATATGTTAEHARTTFLEHIARAERHAPRYTDTAAYRAVLDNHSDLTATDA